MCIIRHATVQRPVKSSYARVTSMRTPSSSQKPKSSLSLSLKPKKPAPAPTLASGNVVNAYVCTHACMLVLERGGGCGGQSGRMGGREVMKTWHTVGERQSFLPLPNLESTHMLTLAARCTASPMRRRRQWSTWRMQLGTHCVYAT